MKTQKEQKHINQTSKVVMPMIGGIPPEREPNPNKKKRFSSSCI